ncbi:MAG TPA: ATP-binding protein [Sphingomonas sp.]|jgi:nitrogen fixation/metabolism regulation signal transduction histidine kinase|uniref:sensor histidine kinase n=1 Tax=Sphingomonas sp. TaxID=28214 RepID=UPI002ED942DA
MGSDRRFIWGLAGWVVALAVALVALTLAIGVGRMGAVTLLTGLGVIGALIGLVRHVERTNVMLARFVEALRHGDFAMRFDARGGSGFAALGDALSAAMRDLQSERVRITEEVRFWEAMIDDLPVPLLTIDARSRVERVNKAARQLFDRHDGADVAAFGVYGDALRACLSRPAASAPEIVPLHLAGGTQRAIVRIGVVARLGHPVRVLAIQPVQGALDAAEVGTQTDLVRVLTHEILNSLTPVTSLAGTTAMLLAEATPDIAEARLAVMTLARRAEGMRRFIDSYRMVARLPEPRQRSFAAAPFAAELERLFRVEWTGHRLDVAVDPSLVIVADPDLLAQMMINLLRNAAQATQALSEPQVRLRMRDDPVDGPMIAVEDNGPGVPAAARRDVFLPFFTTRASGTGIGLNIARQIAVAHGWRIEIGDSDLGGAAMRLFLTRSFAVRTG